MWPFYPRRYLFATMNRTERHAGDVVRVFLGIAIVGLTTVVAVVGPVGAIERNAFRLVNDLPDAFEPVLTAVQQWGAFYAVLIAAGVALLARRPRLAMSLAVSGTTAYLAARLLKALVERGRPAAELADAIIRGIPATGLGFPSGHSAVAAALATALTPYLPRWGRRAMWGVVFTGDGGADLPGRPPADRRGGWGGAGLGDRVALQPGVRHAPLDPEPGIARPPVPSTTA